MERCYKCSNDADYICPDCGTRVCKSHMETRYPGPHHKNFTSNYMCPVCWLVKRVMLDENMLRVEKDGTVHPSKSDDSERHTIFPVRAVKGS